MLFVLLLAIPAWGQFGGRVASASSDQDQEDIESKAEQKFPGGAPLKTDPELERLLNRAEKFAKDERYDLAAVLWQKVLDDTGDTLITRDGRSYTPLAVEVEKLIAKLPPQALRIYRVTADGEAQAVLAAARNEQQEQALAAVVRRFFMSSHGDDAAYRLGCMALDRYDFVGAARLFTKILDQHPDPSISRAEILLRLAVAGARLGDARAAKDALVKMDGALGAPVSVEIEIAVRSHIENLRDASSQVVSNKDRLMRLGGPDRRGLSPSLPAAFVSDQLHETWNTTFDLTYGNPISSNSRSPYISSSRNRRTTAKGAKSREDLIKRWKENGWFPTGQLLLQVDEGSAGSRLYIKTHNDLTCWDLTSRDDQPIWRSAWLNTFKYDDKTQMMVNMRQTQQTPARPWLSPPEVQFFGDRIYHSMSISHGQIYNIEGPRVSRYGAGGTRTRPAQNRIRGYAWVMPRRSRKNWLACYEADTGRALWYRAPESPDDASHFTGQYTTGRNPIRNGAGSNTTGSNSKLNGADSNELGFLAAPVPYGNLLLVPVTDGGVIWLYALSRFDGSTVWTSYLCDEPTGGCDPWSPVCVSIAGSDAYVVCGAGVIFSVDAVSGAIRFAVRYQRDGRNSNVRNVYGRTNAMLQLKGFKEDVVIPHGRALVVLATDHDELFALDRRTGEMLWRSPRTPFEHGGDYCLGVSGDSLFMAARKIVRRYDLQGGKLMWEQEIPDATGRGVLTGPEPGGAIYLPVFSTEGGSQTAMVRKLSLDTGETLADARVEFDGKEAGAPLGNLYTDGKSIYVVAGNRVYALTNGAGFEQALEQRIKSGPIQDRVQAQLDRMQSRLRRALYPEAIADLQAAYKMLTASDTSDQAVSAASDQVVSAASDQAVEVVLATFENSLLTTANPTGVLKLLGELLSDQDSLRRLSNKNRQRLQRQCLLALEAFSDAHNQAKRAWPLAAQGARTNGSNSHTSVPPEALDVALKLVSHLPTKTLSAAARAIKRAAGEKDVRRLTEAIRSGDAALKYVSAEALAKIQGQTASETLAKLLEHDDGWVRLAASRGLANLGDRRSVGAFIDLLSQPDSSLAMSADFALRVLTGEDFGFFPFKEIERRQQAISGWRDWAKGRGAEARLHSPLPDESPWMGRKLVCCESKGLILEFGPNQVGADKEYWRRSAPSAWTCQALANGRRLIACRQSKSVIEFDASGSEVWRSDNLPGMVFSAQRLANGNTLAACYESGKVVEVDMAGTIVWQYAARGKPVDARRLSNGNTLVTLVFGRAGSVVEITPQGKETWSAKDLTGILKASRLPSGNTLVVLSSQGRVVELNGRGEPVWIQGGLNQPTDAVRLPSGNTLIAAKNRLVEVLPSGDVVWDRVVEGVTGVSSY